MKEVSGNAKVEAARPLPARFRDNDPPIVLLSKRFLRLVFRLFFRIEYAGLHHIPATGPALIVPNHQSYLDPMLVGAALPRSVRYMAMKKLFKWRPVAAFLRFYGAFPVTLRSADKGAIKSCIRFLRAGELVIIFPEGGRSRDGSLRDFLQGFARIAVMEQVPVVPVTISGAYRVWPPSHRLPRPGKIRLTFHPPLHPGDFPRNGEATALAIAERTQKTIAAAL